MEGWTVWQSWWKAKGGERDPGACAIIRARGPRAPRFLDAYRRLKGFAFRMYCSPEPGPRYAHAANGADGARWRSRKSTLSDSQLCQTQVDTGAELSFKSLAE